MQMNLRHVLRVAATAFLFFSVLSTTYAASAVPQPDLSTPLERYEVLQSGNQVMFQYYARSGVPLDYSNAAGYMSVEYRQTSDTFRQHDMLEALKPRIDAAMAHAKANPYLRMDIDLTGSSKLSSYDFKQKGFAIADIFDEGSWRYFGDNGHYQFAFSNGTRYKFLPVADEGAARAVETRRSKHQPLTLRIYMFANDVDTFNEHTKMVVTRVELLGQGGQMLSSYAGSVKPEVKKQDSGIAGVHGWF